MSDLLVVFPGIHQTLSAEGTLKSRGVTVTLVPTPPAISLGCGFSILTPQSGGGPLPDWWNELATKRVLYRVVLKEGRKEYEEIDRREGPGVPAAGDHEPQGDDGGRPR